MSLNLYADFAIKRGDTDADITAVLRDGTGAIQPLDGATVKFSMREFDTGMVTILLQNAEIVLPAANGKVKYAWQGGDTDDVGYFYAEWQVTYGGGGIQTFPSNGYHLISIQHDLDTPFLTDGGFATIRRLRSIVAEESQTNYSDSLLDAVLFRNGDDIDLAAAEVWREKAAAYADLVDVNNAGSSRKLSQLYDRAVKQAELHEVEAGAGPTRGARTRAIERA